MADGAALVDQAGKTMGEIVASVQRVTDIMAEISAASQEQSAGIEQVNQAITQMDETTQQNAALVEEAAAAARSMEEQAGALTQSVSVFKLSRLPVPRCASPRWPPRHRGRWRRPRPWPASRSPASPNRHSPMGTGRSSEPPGAPGARPVP